MATASLLNQYEEEEAEYNKLLAAVVKQLEQTLPRATAQLAVISTDRTLRGSPDNIVEREGFDPENPSGVLSSDELQGLPEAKLVVDALASYVDLQFRLEKKKTPRIHNGYVHSGRV